MKIKEMADIFFNLANFAKHTFSTLAPPSGYALNLKALIKVPKVSWTSLLSYEILRSSFERKFDKKKLHFSEKDTSQKVYLLGLWFPPLNSFPPWLVSPSGDVKKNEFPRILFEEILCIRNSKLAQLVLLDSPNRLYGAVQFLESGRSVSCCCCC